MQQSYGTMNHDFEKWDFEGAPGCVPITCQDFLIMSNKGYNYYVIDLKLVDWNKIWNIIKACEAVENECWKAQENFFDYLKKCDVLSYTEKDGRIIAFDAVTLLCSGTTCIYSNDETMVLKAFRGKDIARKLVMATCEWYLTKTEYLKGIKHVIFLSISANPRVVNGYFKNSYTRILFDCSFKPSKQLIALKEEYCRKHNIALVHKDYPFCLKNLFPGSNNFDCNDPRFQFSREVKANMPPDFDHMVRGDAFAFMLKVSKASARTVVLLFMLFDFGKDYLSRKGVGLFSSRKKLGPTHTEAWQTPKPVENSPSIGVVRAPDKASQGISASLSQQ